MLNANEQFNRQYHEMRWRILSLAADFDRLQRADGGESVLQSTEIKALRECVQELLATDSGRAERVQMILSDRSPPPR